MKPTTQIAPKKTHVLENSRTRKKDEKKYSNPFEHIERQRGVTACDRAHLENVLYKGSKVVPSSNAFLEGRERATFPLKPQT